MEDGFRAMAENCGNRSSVGRSKLWAPICYTVGQCHPKLKAGEEAAEEARSQAPSTLPAPAEGVSVLPICPTHLAASPENRDKHGGANRLLTHAARCSRAPTGDGRSSQAGWRGRFPRHPASTFFIRLFSPPTRTDRPADPSRPNRGSPRPPFRADSGRARDAPRPARRR